MTPAQFRIVEALCDHGPMTGQQVAKRAHVSFKTFKDHCKAILIENGMIHQSGWERYRYGYKPVFSAGVGKTPNRPIDTRGNAQRCKDWKRKTGYCDPRKAMRRLRRPPDRALAALLGIRA